MVGPRRVLVLVALVAGCPDAHPSPSRDAAVRLLEEMDETICARLHACASWSSYSDAPCDTTARSYRVTALGAGEAELDVARAEACIEGVRALGECTLRVRDAHLLVDPLRALEETCRDAFQPIVDCGGEVCAPEDPCAVSPDCTFYCRDLPGLGEACTSVCGLGLECEDGRCTRRSPAGAPCQGGGLADVDCIRFFGPGDPCIGMLPCDPASYCVEGTCTDTPPRLAIDSACTPEAVPLCVRGAICDATLRRCLPRFEVEGWCSDHHECRAGTFCDGSRCVPEWDGVPCEARSLDLAWADECPEGYLCAPDRRCRRTLALGDPCTLESACPLGTLCSDGRCWPIAFAGEACTAEVACRFSQTCVGGACVFRSSLPSPCASDAGCDEGRCTSGECRPLPDGAACERETDCPRCLDGVCQAPEVRSLGEGCALGDPDAACGSGLTCAFGTDPGSGRCCPH